MGCFLVLDKLIIYVYLRKLSSLLMQFPGIEMMFLKRNIGPRMVKDFVLRWCCRDFASDFGSHVIDFLSLRDEDDLVQLLEKFLFLENPNR